MGKQRKNKGATPAAQAPAPTSAPTPAIIGHGGKLAIQAQYDAARMGRRLASWNPPSSGPNKAITGLQTMRNRSRDAARNEPNGASTIRNFVVDMVGTGITARPRTKKASLKAKLTELWGTWIKQSDADGVLDLYGQQELLARTWKEAGEVFARLRPRRVDDGLDVPLQIQLLEPEMCPCFDRDLPNGNRVRQGIEINRIGQRVAYWMYREHPGDGTSTINFNELVPIPADQIMHIYKQKRIGQLRGVPEMVSTLVKMKTVGDYDDAVIERAKVQNLYAGFITRPEPNAGNEMVDPLSGKTIQFDSAGSPMVSLEPGGMVELAPGEEVLFSNPPATGVGYDDFMRQQGLNIAGGNGVPYEIMSGDIREISDRTLRVVIQQYRRHIEQEQWLVIIPMFCAKVRDAWVDAAVLAGQLSPRDAWEAKNVEWSPQAWAYIHPVQDVQSKQMEVTSGFASRSSVISSRGYDPEQVDAERAEDHKRELALGIAPPVPDPNAKKNDPKAQAVVARIEAQTRLLDAQATAAGNSAQAELDRAQAYAQTQAEEAARARAEAAYHAALQEQAQAESGLADATVARVKADAEAAKADAEYRRALASQESEARVQECEDRATAARNEADARIAVVASAETFAAEQRALVLQAERDRAETARLDTEAARAALAELRDGQQS